jgi:hypothetical protein
VLKATSGRQVPWEHTSLTGQVVLRPEPRLGAAQGKDYDKEMEIAYWNSVRDTKSVAALQAYLDRYPRGTFAGLARAMITDQGQKQGGAATSNITVASKDPAIAPKTQAAVGDDQRTLARALRKELERVGCITDADGGWDDRTKQALTEFSRHAKIALATDAPSMAALEALQARKGRVCPLKCGKNEVEDDGECVAKKREPSRAPRRAEGESGSSGSKQKFCWTQEPSGRQAVVPCGR